MQTEQKKMIGYVAVAGALCAALIYTQFRASPNDAGTRLPEGAGNAISSSTDGMQPVIIEVASSTGTKVLPKPIPPLNRTVSFPSRIAEAQRSMIQVKITELSATLTTSPEKYEAWIELGLVRKSIDDFEGARQAWEYASKLLPTGTQSFFNLFDLYAFYLHDNAQALKNIETAIGNNPKDGFGYAQLYAFYTDVTDEKEKAIAVLKRAIAARVTDVDRFQEELDRVIGKN